MERFVKTGRDWERLGETENDCEILQETRKDWERLGDTGKKSKDWETL